MDKQSRALLAAIMETAVDSIIVIDSAGIVQLANPATEALFGVVVADLVGQNVNVLMPTPHQEAHDGYLRNYLTTGVAKIIGIGREVIGRRKDGSEFPLHLAVSEISVDGQRLFAGIIRDITHLKAAETKLQEMNDVLEQRVQERTAELHAAQADLIRVEKLATLGQVSGGIAHEIRNPLNAIKTSAYYLLNAKHATPEKVAEHLERIDRQVSSIDHVVTALSDVARLPDPHVESCDLRPIVREVVRETSLPSQVLIDDQLPVTFPNALFDTKQIPIVIRNIIRNARDSMPDGGTMTLSALANNDELSISIKDTGCGISAENMSRITEPLFSTKQAGMGLGLAITKAILDKNRGRLEVASSMGDGSTFTIVLPVANRSTDGSAAEKPDTGKFLNT
ncbi:two-component system sensor histidine kinase NtrB [Planctomycetes bacterium K23_9]|uniref:Sensor protein FixL n=1 Tax=Stieleria marina TaxID=1930275 RepID=A0A517NQV7_9BACT|nr:Sensor protein FixL [Planctomycetes bacterium K23_9]